MLNPSVYTLTRRILYFLRQVHNIHIQGTGVFLLYAMPFRLFLGDMLTLWAEGCWKENEDYFYCITGSPLSGSNSSSYWSETAGFSYKSNAGKNFMDMFCL